jgi:death-on-curing protein
MPEIRYLTEAEIIELHDLVVEQSGGGFGLRDPGALSSAAAQPGQSFGGADLYEGAVAKAAALCFFLASNHPFLDGNKRIAHAAMEVMLLLNGLELEAGVDEQERVMLQLASGKTDRDRLTAWLATRTTRIAVN